MIRYALLSLLFAAPALAQQAPAPAMRGDNVTVAGRPLPQLADRVFYAQAFGSCTWSLAGDVGPCIQAAINAAAAAGGGRVVLPAGHFGLATELRQTSSGVRIEGEGVGVVRPNTSPHMTLAATRLRWIGAANATMLYVGPATDTGLTLYGADVTNFALEGNNLAHTALRFAQVSWSRVRINTSDARMVNAHLTTLPTSDSGGTQHNHIWLTSRSDSATYSPTGILADGGVGSPWNVSYNEFDFLFAWYNRGDGIVFGNSDNNRIRSMKCFPQPGATGTSAVFASAGYIQPNGMQVDVTEEAYTTIVDHMGCHGSVVQGFNAPGVAIVTPNPANAGSASFATISKTTNAIMTNLSALFPFADYSGVASGMRVDCGGPASGLVNPARAFVIGTAGAGSAIETMHPLIREMPSGTVCQFFMGVTASAATAIGTHTVTAVSATNFDITGPPTDPNGRFNVALVNGTLTTPNFVIPITGTAQAGDRWTIELLRPAREIWINQVDAPNSISNPRFDTGALTSGFRRSDAIGWRLGTFGGLALGASEDVCSAGRAPRATGSRSVAIGGCQSNASGEFSLVIGGSNTAASGFNAAGFGGLNATASGNSSFVQGEGSVASNQYSNTRGGFGTDRGDTADVWASGRFSSTGDAQARRVTLRAALATTSAVRLTSNGAAASATNGVSIPTNAVYQLDVRVSCRDTTNAANWAVWSALAGSLTRGSGTPSYTGAASTATAPSQSGGTSSAARVTLAADTSLNTLSVSVTWPNTSAARCVAEVQTVEVQ